MLDLQKNIINNIRKLCPVCDNKLQIQLVFIFEEENNENKKIYKNYFFILNEELSVFEPAISYIAINEKYFIRDNKELNDLIKILNKKSSQKTSAVIRKSCYYSNLIDSVLNSKGYCNCYPYTDKMNCNNRHYRLSMDIGECNNIVEAMWYHNYEINFWHLNNNYFNEKTTNLFETKQDGKSSLVYKELGYQIDKFGKLVRNCDLINYLSKIDLLK